MENHTDKLADTSVAFAVEVLNLVQQRKSRHETILCNRIGRAGNGIGATIHEARYAHGKAGFVSEPQIASKEADETGYRPGSCEKYHRKVKE